MLGKFHSQETRAKISLSTKLAMADLEVRARLSNRLIKRWEDLEYQRKMSKIRTELWKKLDYRERTIRAIAKGNKRGLTQPEVLLGLILEDLYPGEFSYNGNGPIVISDRVPDFVHNNGQKLAICMHGDYFHRNEDVAKLKKEYKENGCDLLIIWESEINRDWSKVIQKVRRFVDGTLSRAR